MVDTIGADGRSEIRSPPPGLAAVRAHPCPPGLFCRNRTLSSSVRLTRKETRSMYDSMETAAADNELNEIREAGSVQRAERILREPTGREDHASAGDEVLCLCANNYLGLSNDPGPDRGERAHGPRASTGSDCPASASSAAPRTSTRQLEEQGQRLPRHRGHDPLHLVLRRQRRPVRDRYSGPEDAIISTPSTTPRSSTVCVSARRSASATPTTTWRTSERCLQESRTRASA